MWSLKKPSAERVSAFLAQQSRYPYSYREVGCSRSETPAGYDLDHNRIPLGAGRAVFETACAAVRRWRMFPGGWTEIHPGDTPIEAGQAVALLVRAFGLWRLNACRIVYVIDEAGPACRFGFAYGTLPGHVERGEERFTIEWGPDDLVWYDIRAFSRPRHWLVRLGYTLARRLQQRFVRESQAAMRRMIELATPPPPGPQPRQPPARLG